MPDAHAERPIGASSWQRYDLSRKWQGSRQCLTEGLIGIVAGMAIIGAALTWAFWPQKAGKRSWFAPPTGEAGDPTPGGSYGGGHGGFGGHDAGGHGGF